MRGGLRAALLRSCLPKYGMRLDDLFESEETDRLDRLRATIAHGQIKYWLEANSDRLSRSLQHVTDGKFAGSYIMNTALADLDTDYPNLYVVFTPAKMEIHGQYYSAGGFFQSGRKFFIVIPCLLRPNDTTYLSTRFGAGGKTPFIHEFIHYLLNLRTKGQKGSARHVETGDMASYFNDPQETNAHYQEAAQQAIEFYNAVVRNAPQAAQEWKEWTTQQFVHHIKKTYVDKSFLEFATPQTMRALDKRLARFVEQTVKPLIAKA
jgi:hypothetical protein